MSGARGPSGRTGATGLPGLPGSPGAAGAGGQSLSIDVCFFSFMVLQVFCVVLSCNYVKAWCFAPVKRSAGMVISEMTCNVLGAY